MTLHWPRTPVQIDSRRFDLCFNLGAVAQAQQEFDRRGVEVNLLEAVPEFNLANVRLLFPCGLRKYHPGFDVGAAQRLVTWQAVYSVAAALRAAWHAAAPIPDEDKKQGKREKQQVTKQDGGLTRDRQWQRLWSLAIYDLGLTTVEFYDCTLGQLDALIRRHERAARETEFLFGQLGSLFVNFSMAHPKEAVHARDFMPSEWANNPDAEVMPKRRRKRQTIATEIRATMDAWMRNQNG